MEKIDVEQLMREAKILYWHEGNTIYQQSTVGIQDKIENTENIDEPTVIKL